MTIGLFLGTAVLAQEAPKVELFWNKGAGLLGYWQVRDELKLTADQVARIGAGGDKAMEDLRAAADRKLAAQERRARAESLQRMVASLPEYLTQEQAARFRQIQLWEMGHRAFIEPDVVMELMLTAEQVVTLKMIDAEHSNKAAELRRQNPIFGRIGPGISEQDAKKDRANRSELRATTEKACLEVLIDEQRDKFEKMRGAKFELELPHLR